MYPEVDKKKVVEFCFLPSGLALKVFYYFKNIYQNELESMACFNSDGTFKIANNPWTFFGHSGNKLIKRKFLIKKQNVGINLILYFSGMTKTFAYLEFLDVFNNKIITVCPVSIPELMVISSHYEYAKKWIENGVHSLKGNEATNVIDKTQMGLPGTPTLDEPQTNSFYGVLQSDTAEIVSTYQA